MWRLVVSPEDAERRRCRGDRVKVTFNGKFLLYRK